MKKLLTGCIMMGLVSTMVGVTGCTSRGVQVNPVPGETGLLGTRGQVPPPLAHPGVLKAIQPGAAEVTPAPAESAVAAAEPAPLAPAAAENQPAFVPAPAPAATAGTTEPLAANIAQAPQVEEFQPGLNYTVKKGDTLSSIARSYCVTLEGILKVNGLSGNSLQVGQVLAMPADAVEPIVAEPAPAKPAAAKTAEVKKPAAKPVEAKKPAPATAKKRTPKPLPADGKYTVKNGDSLSVIGHTYGIPYSQIRSDNNLKSDTLRIGQVLILKPAAKKAAPTAKATTAKKADKAKATKNDDATPGLSSDKYSVKSGDNLWTIARKFKVKSSDIIAWNDLKNTRLRIGQVLIISKDAPAAEAPKPVEAIDINAEAPAPAAPAPAETVVDLQPAAPEAAAPVQEAAPAAAEPVVVNAAPAENIAKDTLPTAVNEEAPKAAASTATYTVQEGETLNAILRTHMMSVEKFKELNPWYNDGEELKPGTEVKVTFEN